METVAAVFDTIDGIRPNPSAYLRVILPLTKGKIQERFDVRFSDAESIGRFDPSIVIVQRTATDTIEKTDALLQYCKSRGARLIFDLDDDLFSLPEGHPDFAFFERRKDILFRLAAEADETWVSTAPLAERLKEHAENVVTIRNVLDDRLWRPPPKREGSPQPIRCVYAGGSSHRADLFEIVQPAISKLRSEFGGRFAFDVIGITGESPSDAPWRSVQPTDRVANCYPAFATWLQHLPGYDIGVAPLHDIPFNYVKSEVKWMEYSAMGLATVASNLPPYANVVEHEQTGLLVGADWQGFYEGLGELLDSPEKLRLIRHNALEAITDMTHTAGLAEPRLGRLVALTSSAS